MQGVAEHGFDGVFPACGDFDVFAEAGVVVKLVLGEPLVERVVGLPERGFLQGFQRGKLAFLALQLAACLVKFMRQLLAAAALLINA